MGQLVYPVDGSPEFAGSVAVLPVGVAGGSSGQRVDVRAWSGVLRELSAAADAVIVNGPSVLDATDAPAMAARCRGTVLVIARDGVDAEIGKTHERLVRHGAQVLGLIVNPGDRTLRRHTPLGDSTAPKVRVAPVEPGAEYLENT